MTNLKTSSLCLLFRIRYNTRGDETPNEISENHSCERESTEVITKEGAVSQRHSIFFLDWALLDIVIIVILVIIPRPSSTSFQAVCLKLVGASWVKPLQWETASARGYSRASSWLSRASSWLYRTSSWIITSFLYDNGTAE